MKLILLSDLHERLIPLARLPPADAILFCGDFAFRPRFNWMQEEAIWNRGIGPWLEEVKEKYVTVGIAGNHDSWPYLFSGVISRYFTHYLENSFCEIDGLRIFGSPYTLPFCDWAFAMDEKKLDRVYSQIDSCDIFMSHGPPYGILDLSGIDNTLCGSHSLLAHCERLKPKLVAFGHIHHSFGHVRIGETDYVNCTWVNEGYNPRNQIYTWEDGKVELCHI